MLTCYVTLQVFQADDPHFESFAMDQPSADNNKVGLIDGVSAPLALTSFFQLNVYLHLC